MNTKKDDSALWKWRRMFWIVTAIIGALIAWSMTVNNRGLGIGIEEHMTVAASGGILGGGFGAILFVFMGKIIIRAISGEVRAIVELALALAGAGLLGYACWWGSGHNLLIACLGGAIGLIIGGGLINWIEAKMRRWL